MSRIIYEDALVSITESEIIFEHYYYPSGKRKVVRFADVDNVLVSKPTIWNGKWRLQGTGNFKTWYPLDAGRPGRDRIFRAALKNQWVAIGFTVEDGGRVEKILKDKNLLRTG